MSPKHTNTVAVRVAFKWNILYLDGLCEVSRNSLSIHG
jgi:hypothetical protein